VTGITGPTAEGETVVTIVVDNAHHHQESVFSNPDPRIAFRQAREALAQWADEFGAPVVPTVSDAPLARVRAKLRKRACKFGWHQFVLARAGSYELDSLYRRVCEHGCGKVLRYDAVKEAWVA
jgi:hypothetical protein